MAVAPRDTQTKILLSAKQEFYNNGFDGARLQRIADRVGVTKAMVHYYFDTKQVLFEQIYQQAAGILFEDINELLQKDYPLFKKIEQLIETCLHKSESHPNVLSFVISEGRRKEDWLQSLFEDHQLSLAKFDQELNQAAENYEIAAVSADQVLINIFSLCFYPVISLPLSRALLQVNGQNENARKGIILDTILNWLTS